MLLIEMKSGGKDLAKAGEQENIRQGSRGAVRRLMEYLGLRQLAHPAC
jgi:hypothetical protein